MPGIREQLAQALAGRYAVERELGAGGMATVYLARDLKHDRAVAIKVVRPEIAAAFGAERFLREVAISAHLQHPNILTLIDSGEASGLLYCVMPYIEGETLRARLAREGPLPATDAARILRDVLDALAYAHRQGIVHRDIKPDNIMLAGRHAFVMDFGIAKAATAAAELSGTPHATLTTLGLAIGTPAYMAPEQAAGERTIDGRADLYAVGVVGYELLSGKPPFAGASAQAILAAQITRTPDPLGAAVPDLPAGLGEAIMRCLEKDPAARWQSAEELLARIEEYSTPGGGLSAAPLGSRASAPAGAGRGRLLLAAVILAVGGGLLWIGPGQRYRQARWAREQAIPQLLALSDRGQWDSAYALARRVDSIIPDDSLFKALRPKFARRVNILTDPAGAMVWRKDYAASDSAWVRLGPTPLDSILMALSVSRLRIESPGRRTLELAAGVFNFPQDTIRLPVDSTVPQEMIPIPAAPGDGVPARARARAGPPLGDYLMDRYEVTNSDYKRFVDSGGYRRQEYWEYPFVKDGQPDSLGPRDGGDDRSHRAPGALDLGGRRVSRRPGGVSGRRRQLVRSGGLREVRGQGTANGVSLVSGPRASRWEPGWCPSAIFPARAPAGWARTGESAPSATTTWRATSGSGATTPAGTERFILGGGWNDAPVPVHRRLRPAALRSLTDQRNPPGALPGHRLEPRAWPGAPLQPRHPRLPRRNDRLLTPSSTRIAGCTSTTILRLTPRWSRPWMRATGRANWSAWPRPTAVTGCSSTCTCRSVERGRIRRWCTFPAPARSAITLRRICNGGPSIS